MISHFLPGRQRKAKQSTFKTPCLKEIIPKVKSLLKQKQENRILLYLVEPRLRKNNTEKLDELETLVQLYGVFALD